MIRKSLHCTASAFNNDKPLYTVNYCIFTPAKINGTWHDSSLIINTHNYMYFNISYANDGDIFQNRRINFFFLL